MDVVSYLLGKKAGGGGSTPSLQNKELTITENGNVNVSADTGYDGLGTVGVTTNVRPDLESKSITISENTTTAITPSQNKDGLSSVSVTTNVQPDLETKNITINQNGTTTVTPTTGKDGLSSVSVITNVDADMSDYLQTTINNSDFLNFPRVLFKRIPTITITGNPNNFNLTFDQMFNLTELPNVITPRGTNVFVGNCQYFARDCKNIPTIPNTYNFNGVTNASIMFQGCTSFVDLSNLTLDFSNVTTASQTFQSCTNLVSAPNITFTKVTNCQGFFKGCSKLVTAPPMNLSTAQNVMELFSGCIDLENVPVYDFSSVQSFWVTSMFDYCRKLSDTSLDNILQSCLTFTSSYTGSKTLATLLGNNYAPKDYYPVSRIEALPHYQDFLDAGWTIGY